MHMSFADVHDSGAFADFVRTLVDDDEFAGTFALQPYLQALWGLILSHQDDPLSWTLFAWLVEESFAALPIPFDDAWLAYENPPDLTGDAAAAQPFAALQSLILYQIADLQRMRAAGTLDLPGEVLFSGVQSPTGYTWYNFSTWSFLECGARSMDNSVHKADCGWIDLAVFLWCGQIYE